MREARYLADGSGREISHIYPLESATETRRDEITRDQTGSAAIKTPDERY